MAPHVSVYSLSAGAVLALALVAIVVRMRWFELEILGIVASYVNHYVWLRPIIGPMHGHHRPFPGIHRQRRPADPLLGQDLRRDARAVTAALKQAGPFPVRRKIPRGPSALLRSTRGTKPII